MIEDDEIDQIRKAQLERSQNLGKVASMSSVSYDQEFYSGPNRDDFNTELNDEYDEDEDDKEQNNQNSRQKFLNSFSAPKSIFKDTYSAEQEEEDVFKDYKKKTIAEKEGEYRSRWRKRAKLSPPRLDPYKKPEGDASQFNSYREIMTHANLEKERAELVRKIEMKKREEREQQKKEERKKEREKKDRLRKEKKGKSSDDEDKRRKRSRSRSGSPRRGKQEDDRSGEWKLDIMKNGGLVDSIYLDSDMTLTIGRGDDSDIKVEHMSCSKNHAKISFVNDRPSIMDLGSTNGTTLNGEELSPHQWYKLSEKDVLKFGCSTRDYHVKFNR